MRNSAPLRLNLLGSPEVWLGKRRLSTFGTAKTEALLYFLAATGEIHRRETLAGLLWGEMPEPGAKRNLTQSLSALRRLMAPCLTVDHRSIGLDWHANILLDLTLARQTAARGDLHSAVSFYRGDFLDGFYVKAAPAFDAWMVLQREQLREQLLGWLETLADQAHNRGDYESGWQYTHRLLELDPWRESAHRMMMLNLARQGQFGAAARQFDRCCQVLQQELGVEPMPETTALFRRIQSARSVQPAPLPADSEPFVGRRDELVRIGELLTDPACRLISLVGLGGMGKTRLALSAARQASRQGAQRFLNGVVFIPLSETRQAGELAQAIAEGLGLPLSGQAPAEQVLLDYLTNKEMLLVLDNFEQVREGSSMLGQLLNGCPSLKILVTSREPLQLTAEWRLDVEGLVYPFPSEDKDGLKQASDGHFSALELFVQAAGQVQASFAISDADMPAMIRLCQQVAGMPLALKLAAAWVRVMTIEDIVAEIDRGLDLLESGMKDLPARQRSVRAVFQSTWEQLADAEQQAFRNLSVFRGGFSPEAARQVAEATPPILSGLVDRGLVQVLDAGKRYSLHELSRQFGQQQLARAGRGQALAQRHAAYFAGLAGDYLVSLTGPDHRQAVRWFRLEQDNVRRAWNTVVDEALPDLLDPLIDAFGLFLESQAQFAEGIQRFGRAAQRLDTAENRRIHPQRIARLMGWLGTFHFYISPQEEAEGCFRDQLYLARQHHDELNQAAALLGLARIFTENSRFAESREHARAALDIFRRLQWPRGEISAMSLIGISYASRRQPDAARYWYLQAVDTGRTCGDIQAYLLPLINLGYLATDVGRYAEANEYFQEAWKLCQQTETRQTGRLLYLMGRLAAFMGEYPQALSYFEQSREARLREGSDFQVARSERWLGRMYQLIGDVERARRTIRRSLQVGLRAEHATSILIAQLHLGLTEEAAGNLDRALKLFDQGLTIARELERHGDIVFTQANRSRVLIRMGDLPRARLGLQEAYAVLDPEIDPRGALNILASTAAYQLASDDLVPALQILYFIPRHPAATAETRDRVAKMLAAVQETSEEQHAAAREYAAAANLDGLVREYSGR